VSTTPPRLTRRAWLKHSVGLGLGIATLTACSGGSSGTSAKPKELILWYEAALPFGSLLPDLAQQYNATNPVVPVAAQQQVELGLKLPVVIGAHDAPHLVIYKRSQAWPLASRNATFPLSELSQRDGVSGTIFQPLAWSGAQHANHTWGMPLTIDALILLYNKKLFTNVGLDASHAPITWDDMNAACQALHLVKNNQTEQDGFYAHQDVPLYVWLWMTGGDVLTPDGKAPAFDTPEGQKALQFVIDNVAANGGVQALRDLQVYKAFNEGEQSLFTKGFLGMIAGNSTLVSRVGRSQVAPQVGAAPLPHPADGTATTLADGYYIFSPINSSNPHPEGSWQFMRWLSTTREAQTKLATLGVVPALTAAQQDAAIASALGVQALLTSLNGARYEQDIQGFQEVDAGLEQNMQQAVAGKMSRDQALKDSADRGLKVLKLYSQ